MYNPYFILCRIKNQGADRFARASFYVNAIPQDTDPDRALASVFGVIRNVSVPLSSMRSAPSPPSRPEALPQSASLHLPSACSAARPSARSFNSIQ